ncbi:MAG: hypothetical protein V1866_06315 [archaeon]
MSKADIKYAIFMLTSILSMLIVAASSQAYNSSPSYQLNTYNRNSYYQQDYRYNSLFATQSYTPSYANLNAIRMSGSGNYVGGYGQHGISPFSISSTTCNTFLGCKQNYNSHMYIGNALDYTYYMHPELLAPRYMDNHQRQVKNLKPQAFGY